jgi:hypothetical protein
MARLGENSDRPLSTSEIDAGHNPLPKYASRTQAALTEGWRGAKFGGKWMGIILTVLATLMWTFFFGKGFYLWIWKGVDVGPIFRNPIVLKTFGLTIGVIAYVTFVTAFIGALIMGTAAALSYRKATRVAANDEQPHRSPSATGVSSLGPREDGPC